MKDENLLTAEIDTIESPEKAEISTKKPANLPDKFWDNKREEIRLEAMIASYLHLEKKLSTMVPIPQNEEDKKRIQKLIGVPETADEYKISVPNDLFEVDAQLNQRLLAKGFTEEQAQEVYDLAAEKLVPLIVEMAAEFHADREVERLVEHFGGADKWQEMSRQMLAYGRKNLPADVLDGLACSYEGVLALARMMKAEQPSLKTHDTVSSAGEDDLYSMMKNPKYWRDKDPGFIAKVTDGFEKLYGKK